jgi:hypothetical protein
MSFVDELIQENFELISSTFFLSNEFRIFLIAWLFLSCFRYFSMLDFILLEVAISLFLTASK